MYKYIIYEHANRDRRTDRHTDRATVNTAVLILLLRGSRTARLRAEALFSAS